MGYAHAVGGVTWRFDDLKTLLARASPHRSGDVLAGVAARSAEERVAARMALADLPLSAFLGDVLYEEDDVTRLILESHDKDAFAPVSGLTVGSFREFLLEKDQEQISGLARGITPEMAAAVSKLMRNQDLVSVARKCRVTTRFRCTIGRTTPPTTRAASPPRSWRGCSTAAATR
jgi:ethanolamine ammonia-lyase large subunit